jgi:hypothetical protein
MFEYGRIIIIGESIEEYPEKPIPWKPISWRQNHMILKELKSTIQVINSAKAKVSESGENDCQSLFCRCLN